MFSPLFVTDTEIESEEMEEEVVSRPGYGSLSLSLT